MSNYAGTHESNCKCKESPIRDVQLAHAYVPFQKLCSLLSPQESLRVGTAFPELFSPYRKREYVNLEQGTDGRKGGRRHE